MENYTVFTERSNPPAVNEKEILRYAGIKSSAVTEEISALLKECLSQALPLMRYSACYATYPVKAEKGGVDLGFAKARSKDLSAALSGCSRAVVFCATVGAGIDGLISRYGVTSPLKALLFQAIGAERVESLCDGFIDSYGKTLRKCERLKPRFSAGYGDLDLSFQKEIHNALACAKRIGVTLNQSLLMFPTKSVTAIAGITDFTGESADGTGEKCDSCAKTDCAFRRDNEDNRVS